ncbi:MAG: WD40 repeat domain-containing protein [Muribaculaceae bacterium]|nr:WD40 repeat domain-containing protein [Muribaculaceae bacterium]
MKRHNHYTHLRTIAATAVMGIAAYAHVMAQDDAERNYAFRHAETPLRIEPYSTTVYTSGLHGVQTMRGDRLRVFGKDTVADFRLSPAGNHFFAIRAGKKGKREAHRFETLTTGPKSRTKKFDAKHLGTPLAATFTPDARQLVVATDKGIVMLDPRKFKVTDRIDLVPLRPQMMVMSPNGYFLALVEGKDVVIYNFEDKKIRTRIDAEVKVTDLAFSPDASSMALLTDDGLLSVYDTRTFEVRTMVDDLGQALACDFNADGKYVAVATSPSDIEIVNLVRTSDRRHIDAEAGGMADLVFVMDSEDRPVLVYGAESALKAQRINGLEPYFNRLVSDAVEERMAEWLKMQPGESMEAYSLRVNEESVRRQRRLFEDSISTDLAGDLISMSEITLGNYDRQNGLLAVEFSNMPQIYLPVPEADVAAIGSAADLSISDAQYGVLPDDSFELVYARFRNIKDGKTFIYDNLDRRPMEMLGADTDFVSLDVIRQQQMEEIRLQEVKQQVVAEAKRNNVISDHTNITVDSQVVPAYDADGNRILNYLVKFTYEVDPDFSAVEDFKPGKYTIAESGAATSMLNIVQQAFEGDMAQHLKAGKRLNVKISGTADATPIVRGIAYDGALGEFDEEPVTVDGQLTALSVNRSEGIRTNEQLAFLRAAAVRDHLDRNVKALADMDTRYDYHVGVSKDKGSEFRRITAEFTFVDAF